MLCRRIVTHPAHHLSLPLSTLSSTLAKFSDLADAFTGGQACKDATRTDNQKPQRAILLDLKETEDAVEIRADVPGVQKDDINEDLDKNVLTLRLEHEEKKEESHSGDGKDGAPTWHRSERSRMFVKRSVRLPESADTAAVAASYSDGVLAIHFPQEGPPLPHQADHSVSMHEHTQAMLG